MRLGLLATAAALGALATPANAAVTLVGISGTLGGNTTTVLTSGSQIDPFSSSFSLTFGTNLVEGDNKFTFGTPYSRDGYYSGIITSLAGVLSGRDLSFSRQTCAPGAPPVGCQFTTATAGTFAVSVPEPATWALMLLGFGVVGSAMRRRRYEAMMLHF